MPRFNEYENELPDILSNQKPGTLQARWMSHSRRHYSILEIDYRSGAPQPVSEPAQSTDDQLTIIMPSEPTPSLQPDLPQETPTTLVEPSESQ